jgi:hypothetical protein
MDVGVKHRLPCCFPAIHANVKSLRLELLLEYVLDLSDKIKGVTVFLLGHLPDRGDVSPWYNEHMTFRNWETVWKRKGQLGLSQDRTIMSAENAVHDSGSSASVKPMGPRSSPRSGGILFFAAEF